MKPVKPRVSFKKYFWIFLVASIIGAYYEEIMHIVIHYVRYGNFHYSPRRGVFWGPLSPVYGIGAVFMEWISRGKREKWWMIFLKTAILGGVGEYVMSYVEEMVIGVVSWDYSDKFMNIGGRTTVPYMLFWGILGVILVKVLYPFLSKLLNKIPRKIFEIGTNILMIIVFIDILISWSSLGRMHLRDHKVEPYTFVGELYDKYFDDEYIKKKFPNMEE